MNQIEERKVVIVGAGLSGLTLAYYLKKQGIDFIILERESIAGGVIQTITKNGFTFEKGPNTGVLGNPEAAELFEDLYPSCQLETANSDAKRRLIWKRGKWNALPSGLISAIGTPLFTLKDKFRILGEPFRKKGKNPLESIAELTKRRLGKSFLDYAIDPFIAGIYAGDPQKLVTKYALPKLYNLEQTYGSLIRGGIKKSVENKKDVRMRKSTREVFSVKGGFTQMVLALEKAVGKENIIYNAASTSINLINGGFHTSFSLGNNKHSLQSRFVVTTSGAHTLPDLLPYIEKSILEPITSLEYAAVAQIVVGYKEWYGMPLNAFGGLVPSAEKKNILGILFPSALFTQRAPEEGALLSVFVGGTRLTSALEMSDEELEELVVVNVNRMLNNRILPDLIKIFRYPHAIPQYQASSEERLACIQDLQKRYPGLLLAGNIRDGIGIADRIKQGKSLALHIASEILSQK